MQNHLNRLLKEIADRENGHYEFSEKKNTDLRGVAHFELRYALEFNYQGCQIQMLLITGGQASCTIFSEWDAGEQARQFRIETRTHFERLFWRKQEIFKILCKNKELKRNLQNLLVRSGLSELCSRYKFTPLFTGEIKGEFFQWRIDHELNFEERNQVIEPLLLFTKLVIDLSQKPGTMVL